MAQAMAQVTCPNCRQPFATPVEQVLDVELDPTVKNRLLGGQVNMIVCPNCRMAGSLNLPFIYHDPAKELALVFMPMEAGRTDLERQQLIGSLSRAVLNQMPPEQRKGYLLNPQVFFSYESLVNRVLEADGITQEMVEAQKARSALLKRLFETAAEERPAVISENEALLDDVFFHLLDLNLAQAEAVGQTDVVQRLSELRSSLTEATPWGRRIAVREQALQALQEQPTREKLVELLVASDDPDLRAGLIAFGQPLIDYLFFQMLTQRIETTPDDAQRQRLEAVRQEVLAIREAMQQQAQEIVQARVALLRDLLTTEKPELLARRHIAEMDELFFSLLTSELSRARQAGEHQVAAQLDALRQMLIGLLQEGIPPELLLLNAIMEAESDEQVRHILESNRPLVTETFHSLLAEVEQRMREQGEADVAARAASALAIVRTMVKPPQDRGAGKGTPSGEKPPTGRSGLEIARR